MKQEVKKSEKQKAREEMTAKEYALKEANELVDVIIGRAKESIAVQLEWNEHELREEKALRKIAETRIETFLCMCRSAMEEGKLDREVYQCMSLVRTNGASEDYIPVGYVSVKDINLD
jgi:hypothetical protein